MLLCISRICQIGDFMSIGLKDVLLAPAKIRAGLTGEEGVFGDICAAGV